MPFFKSAKSPADVAKSLREALAILERGEQGGKKALGKVNYNECLMSCGTKKKCCVFMEATSLFGEVHYIMQYRDDALVGEELHTICAMTVNAVP